MSRHALVMALGNPDRGDDGVGHAVAEAVRDRLPAGVDLLHQSGEATEILETWRGAERVVVVDAVASGARVGTVHTLTGAREAQRLCRSAVSTHGLGLAEALALGRVLGTLPAHLTVVGIEGGDFSHRPTLSAEVREAVAAAAEAVLRALAC